MKGIKKILNRYGWDVTCVGSVMRAGCFAAFFLAAVGMVGHVFAGQPAHVQVTVAAKPFTLPVIPDNLTLPADRAGYLITHYWDALDFADTAWLQNSAPIEQAFADYLDIMYHTTDKIAGASIGLTLAKARPVQAVYEWWTDMYEKYLYDPDSPMRDEERYRAVLEQIIADPETDGLYKLRPAAQLEEIDKNRRGSVAADFTYTLQDGATGRLHGIGADYTLLFFYNPDCVDCKRTRELLRRSQRVTELIAAGKLRVLAFYPDEQEDEWRAYREMIPPEWLNGRDASPGQAVKNELYAIRAIPSLYLLDRDKRVLLKDADYYRVEAWLQNNEL